MTAAEWLGLDEHAELMEQAAVNLRDWDAIECHPGCVTDHAGVRSIIAAQLLTAARHYAGSLL